MALHEISLPIAWLRAVRIDCTQYAADREENMEIRQSLLADACHCGTLQRSDPSSKTGKHSQRQVSCKTAVTFAAAFIPKRIVRRFGGDSLSLVPLLVTLFSDAMFEHYRRRAPSCVCVVATLGVRLVPPKKREQKSHERKKGTTKSATGTTAGNATISNETRLCWSLLVSSQSTPKAAPSFLLSRTFSQSQPLRFSVSLVHLLPGSQSPSVSVSVSLRVLDTTRSIKLAKQ